MLWNFDRGKFGVGVRNLNQMGKMYDLPNPLLHGWVKIIMNLEQDNLWTNCDFEVIFKTSDFL